MSIKVNYKGAEILSYGENGTKTLKTGGKYCEGDISITNTQDGGITPTGSIEITENGTYDVTEKASAVVNVSGGGGIPENAVVKVTEYNTNGYPVSATVKGLPSTFGLFYAGSTKQLWEKLTEVNFQDNSGILTFGQNTFNGTNVVEIKVPEGVTQISNNSLFSTPRLRKLYLPSTLTTASNMSYSSRSIDLIIYCKFSEGAVSGAPWGYNNATIIYDYTGD